MSNPSRQERQLAESAVRLASRYPRLAVLVVVVAVVAVVGFLAISRAFHKKSPPPVVGDGRPGTVLFCSWNVENFYDDKDDSNIHDEMEDWMGKNPDVFRTKVDHLAEGLLKMNGGIGPDVACLYEVESERCMTALQEAINAKLDAAGHGDRKYERVLFKGDNTGRHFAPGILTRVGVEGDRTRKLGSRSNGRILEGHLNANGHELIVIAAHWTSRVTDEKDDKGRRISYANDCYGRANAILHENPDADVIVCGDFNDEYKNDSLQSGLHATDDVEAVRNSTNEPRLLDVFANWKGDPAGTIHHQGQWYIFDHICVTRGLLDSKGWSCDPKNASIFAPTEFRHMTSRKGHFEPFRFGNAKVTGERGYSDHFPVTLELSVTGADEP
jgi:endonuclease/exonuclease/phosphatase family metal-dependent hydrolase